MEKVYQHSILLVGYKVRKVIFYLYWTPKKWDQTQKYSLNANPGKTQVCAFHLKNHLANKKLNIKLNSQQLEHTDFYPVYLRVTLDRTLTCSEHAKKVKR